MKAPALLGHPVYDNTVVKCLRVPGQTNMLIQNTGNSIGNNVLSQSFSKKRKEDNKSVNSV